MPGYPVRPSGSGRPTGAEGTCQTPISLHVVLGVLGWALHLTATATARGDVRREGKQLFVSSRGDVRRPPNKTCRHYDNVGRLWTEVVVSLGSDSLGTIKYHLNAYLSPPATTPPLLHDSEPLSARHCLFWNNKRDKRLYLFHCCEYRVSENLFVWCTFLF